MKLVLFDCDGTLVDSQHLIVSAMETAFASLSLAPPTRSRILSIVGLSLPEAMQELGEGDPAFPVETLATRYREAFNELRRQEAFHEPLFPGMWEVLDELHRRDDVLLGIATGKSRRGVTALLERHGLSGWFVTIQTADDARSKPHPEMVHRALAESGVSADRAALIGDTGFDMAMARAGGIRALGVTWGYHSRIALQAAGAEFLVDEAPQLVPLVTGLWQEPN
ncbi:HAD-IA family hydrolase [Ancylobacter terrae]|uniref:HAD-IA family hydrolase n=1 Tax=Ancylobacter sp. sgz301288 TaxID=3342077 RepID=UPI003860074E